MIRSWTTPRIYPFLDRKLEIQNVPSNKTGDPKCTKLKNWVFQVPALKWDPSIYSYLENWIYPHPAKEARKPDISLPAKNLDISPPS